MARKIIKNLASLKLAVVVILLLGTAASVGTIVESKFDTMTAQKLVYQSWYLYLVLGLLAINLISVMVDRWPWQKRHLGFLCAHVGILLLMLGAWITQNQGLDGSLAMGIGESNRYVTTSRTVLEIYKVDPEMGPMPPEVLPVDFWNEKFPKRYSLSKADGDFEISKFERYEVSDRKIQEAPAMEDAGTGIRIQIESSRFKEVEWLLQSNIYQNSVKEMGPAKFVIEGVNYKPADDENSLVFKLDKNQLKYKIHSRKEPGKIKTGTVQAGDIITTGWMDIIVRILKVLPKAKEVTEVRALEVPTPISTSAIQIRHRGVETWVPLNSAAKIFTDKAAYYVAYANERIPLKFGLSLEKFEMGKYPGTARAASYQSRVKIIEGETKSETQLISMNEPLKYRGLTFYQASFNSDPKTGEPMASILSVNADPGRFLKYFGSLLMIFGILHLFYWRGRAAKKEAV